MRESDIESIIKLIREFYNESLHEYSPRVEVSFVKKLCEKYKDTSFVVEVEGNVVGVLGGEFIIDLLNGEKTYAEIVWYVNKNYRRYGIKLLHYVEDWAKQQGSTRFVLCHMGNSKSEKLFHFYQKMNYDILEVHYVKQFK